MVDLSTIITLPVLIGTGVIAAIAYITTGLIPGVD